MDRRMRGRLPWQQEQRCPANQHGHMNQGRTVLTVAKRSDRQASAPTLAASMRRAEERPSSRNDHCRKAGQLPDLLRSPVLHGATHSIRVMEWVAPLPVMNGLSALLSKGACQPSIVRIASAMRPLAPSQANPNSCEKSTGRGPAAGPVGR